MIVPLIGLCVTDSDAHLFKLSSHRDGGVPVWHHVRKRKSSQETLPGPGSESQEGFQADRVSAFVYAGFGKRLWTRGSINGIWGRF
jgi:hypothetical protein